MRNAWIFNAALYCEKCAQLEIDECKSKGRADTGDSDDYPQGPYADGGGEADTPQHCDACGLFLENPLTPDGMTYASERIEEHLSDGTGRGDVLSAWADFYGIPWPLVNAAEFPGDGE